MAIKTKDVTFYDKGVFALIEVKGYVYVVNAEIAKQVKHALTEQMIFTSAEGPIRETLAASAEFVLDIDNGKVLKPTV